MAARGAPRVLVVEHEESCPPALLGGWLADAGLALEVVRPYLGEVLPDLAPYTGLVVLGGAMDAFDDDVPWLGPTRALIRESVGSGTPLLGVCLGHQLAALALGGQVARDPRGQQIGLVGLAQRDEPDAVLDGLTGPGVFWNQDVVVGLPAGAVVLAQATTGEVQAVRYAPRAWGVQWHPEVDAAVLGRWAAEDAERHLERGIDLTAVLADVEAARPSLAADGRRLAEAFAGQVRAAAAARATGGVAP